MDLLARKGAEQRWSGICRKKPHPAPHLCYNALRVGSVLEPYQTSIDKRIVTETKGSSMTLANKVAIITGAAHGIGRAVAERLAAEGVHVTVADIQDETGAEVVAQIEASGGIARFIHTDVGVHDHIRRMVESTVDEWGRLDILVNNAYSTTYAPLVDLKEEDWDRGMAIMLKAVFLGGKYAFPHMERVGGGAIVNMASVHGFMAWPNGALYDTAKAALST